VSVKGRLNADELAIARIRYERLQTPATLTALAGFVDSTTGTTRGWVGSDGVPWSKETMRLLRELTESMERDMAQVHMDTTASGDGPVAEKKTGLQMPEGLGEHLGTEDDAPSI
jgi:hypothetical protein